MTIQTKKALALRALNESGIYVLPNAWDAGSAVLIERAGADIVATTSAGVSWGLGHPDGEQLTREENIEAIRRIAEAVQVPVSADVEAGYGLSDDEVAHTVTDVVAAGAVGINLEDSNAATGQLFPIAEQAERIRAARTAATKAGLPELVINARTDVFLFQIGAPEGRFDDVLERAAAYAEAGADVLFVPGLSDLAVIKKLTAASPLPVNIMVGPGSPSVEELQAAGVRRVSLGSAISQAAYALALRSAREVLTKGTYEELSTAESFADINGVPGSLRPWRASSEELLACGQGDAATTACRSEITTEAVGRAAHLPTVDPNRLLAAPGDASDAGAHLTTSIWLKRVVFSLQPHSAPLASATVWMPRIEVAYSAPTYRLSALLSQHHDVPAVLRDTNAPGAGRVAPPRAGISRHRGRGDRRGQDSREGEHTKEHNDPFQERPPKRLSS
ncbi:isocitrate lyase/PEP mutase family protein [Herbidospora sp. RD11066]